MNEPVNPAIQGGMQFQLQIYLGGTRGIKPDVPVSYEALEQKAREGLKPEAFGYVAGSAGSGITNINNRQAFDRWRIVPKMLTDVSGRNIGTELFGRKLVSPVLMAPVGVLSIVHPEAEIAVAKAAKALQVPHILSTVSSKTLEEVAEANGDNPHWFQLYWGRDQEFTQSLISRAERAGYEAIVVTLDTRLLAWREQDIQQAYLPFLFFEGIANYLSDPVFCSAVGDPMADKLKTLMHFAHCFSNPGTTWANLSEIKDHTKLPVIVKGVLHPDDARKAIDHGADGIIVSNHGGRQVDGAIGALEALPDITKAVGDKTTILFDSGIRRGADIFKAMALGAKAVLLGRPYVYGLALAGEHGVSSVVKNLLADTDLTLGLAGYSSWSEVSRNAGALLST